MNKIVVKPLDQRPAINATQNAWSENKTHLFFHHVRWAKKVTSVEHTNNMHGISGTWLEKSRTGSVMIEKFSGVYIISCGDIVYIVNGKQVIRATWEQRERVFQLIKKLMETK